MRRDIRRSTLGIGIAAVLAAFTSTARADHVCDPVNDRGWKIVTTHEVVDQSDAPPQQSDAAGNWYVERATTVLPYCSYFNATGVYSMRSYSLSPETVTERVQICRAENGGSVAVPPYSGACPPK